MRIQIITLAVWLIAFQATAQMSQAERDSINNISRSDHQVMMSMLNIESLRPGPSGNPDAPNAANNDESKAKTYTSIPDPLVFADGTPVTSGVQWTERRAEIMEDFSREVYGRIPDDVPSVDWKVLNTVDTLEGEYEVTRQYLAGVVDNSRYPGISVTIDLEITLPANIEEPVPVIMQHTWRWPANWPRPKINGPTWKEQLLAEGWGFAEIYPTSFQADNGAGLSSGIIGLVNKGEPRQAEDWGTLLAWSWGASRALDYFTAHSKIDETRVGIAGLSRYGKAALVTLAYDQRFAIGLIGSSGAGGAKILRRTFGEQVENLASWAEYHWFAPNFIKYAGPLTPNDLPVDAHELIAACAPRPVFISVGAPDVEGEWIDARGMFMAAAHAGKVYELLGADGLPVAEFPTLGTSLITGDIAFRQHEGGHTIGPNWPYFIEFARRYFE